MLQNKWLSVFIHWFDAGYNANSDNNLSLKQIDWFRAIPFLVMHIMCLGVIWVGVSTTAVVAALFLYVLRMFAITGFYHRYFSHRAFKTSRLCQFIFAVIGAAATQRGILWWASHHRHHHRYSDQLPDAHSPKQHGFWWSHMGWILSREHFKTQESFVSDLTKYPELKFLNRFDIFVPILLAISLFLLGKYLEIHAPSLHTSGWQLLVWGFFISTVVLFHATCSINSIAHRWGTRPYSTKDESRNNFWLALITLGEGWHNNHHYYPSAARPSFHWWQIDMTYYLLWMLSKCGIIWDLRPLPEAIRK